MVWDARGHRRPQTRRRETSAQRSLSSGGSEIESYRQPWLEGLNWRTLLVGGDLSHLSSRSEGETDDRVGHENDLSRRPDPRPKDMPMRSSGRARLYSQISHRTAGRLPQIAPYRGSFHT